MLSEEECDSSDIGEVSSGLMTGALVNRGQEPNALPPFQELLQCHGNWLCWAESHHQLHRCIVQPKGGAGDAEQRGEEGTCWGSLLEMA